MNTELKFRAWDDGQMIYSDEWKDSIEQERDNDYATLASFFSVIREDAIVMQFIGKTDKNGKEIYAGDIVEWGHNNEEMTIRRAVVEIKPDIRFAVFNHPAWNEDARIFEYGSFAYKNTENHLIVVGNIYQNNGMLNKNEKQ